MKKADLLALLAADETEQTMRLLEHAADTLADKQLREDIVLYRSQWEHLDKEENANTTDGESLLQNRNKIKRALIQLVQALPDELPDMPADAASKKNAGGMEESRFKWYLFLLMLTIKVWIIYWILFHRDAGGFTNGEALATIALLLPAFAAYISPMLADLLRQRHRPALPPALAPRIAPSLQGLTWGLILLYGLLLHNIIGAKAGGRLGDNPAANFENMTKWLAILESGLGVYVGLIVGEFFKRTAER